MRGSRGRGGPPSRGGGFRGGRGGFSSDRDRFADREERGRGGFGRGRGGFSSRGRGGPPRYKDDSPPPRRMSRNFEEPERERGPPIGRRDRYEESFDRGPPPSRSGPPPSRSRDPYHSEMPRDSGRLMDRLSPPRSSFREKEYSASTRDYPSVKGDYMSSRTYSPPRDSGRESGYGKSRGAKETFSSHRSSFRDAGDRDGGFSRPAPREYPPSRMADYSSERPSRDSFRDSSREYPPSRNRGAETFRDAAPREREYSGSRFSARERSPLGGSREYSRGGGRGAPRGGRGGRDDDRGGRGGFMNGGRGRGGPPRGRGRPDFVSSRGGGGRHSPPSRRDSGPIRKAPRIESESYRR